MRRALAITLLLALFAPFTAPAVASLTTDPEAGLPPCCRSHGAHHCAMLHWMRQRADSGSPSFAPAPCASYPAAGAVPQLATFAPATAPLLTTRFHPAAAPPVAARRVASLFTASAQTTRGPPSAMGMHF